MNMLSLHQNVHGGARLKIFIFLLILFLAGGVAGWYLYVRKDKTVLNKSDEPKIPCRSEDKTLCTFITSWEAPRQYRFTVRETSNGNTVTSVYDYDLGEPAKIHAKTPDHETITIGNTLYTKDGSMWHKQTLRPDQTSQANQTPGESTADKDLVPIQPKHYQRIGKEACGDLTCYKYEVRDPNNPDMAEFIWFDDKEYRLRQLSFETAGTISEQTYEYITVRIGEPSPIQ